MLGPIAMMEKQTRLVYTTTTKMMVHHLSSMAQEVMAECEQPNVYQVRQIGNEDLEISVSKASSGLIGSLMAEEGCSMADSCLWQTCQYGSDSCWWQSTVTSLILIAWRLWSTAASTINVPLTRETAGSAAKVATTQCSQAVHEI